MARRARGTNDPSAAYADAKFETTLVVVAMPVVALMSVIGIGSLAFFTPAEMAAVNMPPKIIFAVVVWSACYVAGNLLLGPRLKKYSIDPSPCFQFDTEKDRAIANIQKFSAIAISGAVLPLAALAIVFLLHSCEVASLL